MDNILERMMGMKTVEKMSEREMRAEIRMLRHKVQVLVEGPKPKHQSLKYWIDNIASLGWMGTPLVNKMLSSDLEFALSLLKFAKCPDGNCDGKGTCAKEGPGYDGESDMDIWQCQWCEERRLICGDV